MGVLRGARPPTLPTRSTRIPGGLVPGDVGVNVADCVALPAGVEVPVGEPVLEGVLERVPVRVAVGERDEVEVRVEDLVAELEAVPVWLLVPVCVGEGVLVWVEEAVLAWVAEAVLV